MELELKKKHSVDNFRCTTLLFYIILSLTATRPGAIYPFGQEGDVLVTPHVTCMRSDMSNKFAVLLDSEQYDVTMVAAPAPNLPAGEELRLSVMRKQIRNAILAPLIAHQEQPTASRNPLQTK